MKPKIEALIGAAGATKTVADLTSVVGAYVVEARTPPAGVPFLADAPLPAATFGNMDGVRQNGSDAPCPAQRKCSITGEGCPLRCRGAANAPCRRRYPASMPEVPHSLRNGDIIHDADEYHLVRFDPRRGGYAAMCTTFSIPMTDDPSAKMTMRCFPVALLDEALVEGMLRIVPEEEVCRVLPHLGRRRSRTVGRDRKGRTVSSRRKRTLEDLRRDGSIWSGSDHADRIAARKGN